MNTRSLPLLVAAAVAAAAAQAPAPRAVAIQPTVASRQLTMDRGAAAVWQSLQKLHTRASLLMITAHPDDEDGGVLTYQARGLGARAALLTMNRGEGGQNLMSNDFYDALGLVRTEELLASDRYYGATQYFTRVVDFGFSKTEAETLRQWGHERALADVVRVVREVRPLVIASTFVGGPSDGHGNHAAAGELAQEAYLAAGDPQRFPEQIKEGLRPWAPRKVYARVPVGAFTPQGIYDYASQVYTPGRIFDYVHQAWIEGQPSITVRVPYGGYNPVLAASYLQLARQGLAEQRTQLSGIAVPDLQPASTPYHLYASRVPTSGSESSYYDGMDVSLMGIADLAPATRRAPLRAALAGINGQIEQAMRAFRADHPEAIAPVLAQALAGINALLSQSRDADVDHELRIKQAQCNNAIVQALGLAVSARVVGPGRGGRGGPGVSFQFAIPGQHFQVQTHFASPLSADAKLTGMRLEASAAAGRGWTFSTPAPADSETFEVGVPDDAAYTRPYFTRPNTEQPYYDITDSRYLTLPAAPYPLSAWATVQYHGVELTLAQVVQTVERPEASGIVEHPLAVAPAISVAITPRAGIIPLPAAQVALTVNIHSNVKGPAAGTVRLRLPAGWTASPARAAFSLRHDGEDEPITFAVQPRGLSAPGPETGEPTNGRRGAGTPIRQDWGPRGEAAPAAGEYTITAVADYAGHAYEEGYHTAGYAGLRPYNVYAPATYRTRGVHVAVAPGLNVGYVAGTGDAVAQSLENLGIHVHFLGDRDLAAADLQAYHVIVLGIRAYAARPALRTYNGRLLEFVKNGGVLIVQFQTSEFNHDYGPYPYNLGGSGATVVDETAPVQILQPANPVLSWPNRITAADFQGWVEERGHGFMASWSPQYTPLLSMHDPDQKPQEGGLLYAPYGKGVYVYEGIALYRQLADAVPGAYRLFANLLSLPQRPH